MHAMDDSQLKIAFNLSQRKWPCSYWVPIASIYIYHLATFPKPGINTSILKLPFQE